jgi:hypothetical protein
MSGEKERADAYMQTIERLEPDIAMIDPGAFYASAAISLKRIADALTRDKPKNICVLDMRGVGVIVEYLGDNNGTPVFHTKHRNWK